MAVLFGSLLAATAVAAPRDLVIPTNLHKPRLIVAARDSLNYRLSNDVAKALKLINAGKAEADRIRFLTYGKSMTWQEYANDIDSWKTSGRPQIPDTPFVDLEAENRKIAAPWFRHVAGHIEQWMQDALEFFYLGADLHAFQFKSLFMPQGFLNRAETDELNAFDDEAEGAESERQATRYAAIMRAAEARMREAEAGFRATLNLKSVVEAEQLDSEFDAEGGDFEVLPGNVVITSIGEDEGLRAIRGWLKGSAYENRVLRVDADWFYVGHVDELVSVVPADHPCGFAVLSLDPVRGVQLLREEGRGGLEKMIPKDYHMSSPPGSSILDTNLVGLYERLTLRRKDADESVTSVIEMQALGKKRIDAVLAQQSRDYARLNPACRSIPVVSLPTLIDCERDGDELSECKTLLPNPVNGVVLGRDLLVPDPYLPGFRRDVTERLKAAGLRGHFVDSGFYHGFAGEAHCATNVVRDRN